MNNTIIMHTADWHISVRGNHLHRKNEFVAMITDFVQAAINLQPNFVLILGDIFDKWNANDIERNIYINCINKLLAETNATIIVTNGNHDVQQHNFDFNPGDDTIQDAEDALFTIANSIDDPRYLYANSTGMYYDSNNKSICFAVWNHKSKYSTQDEPYSPWLHNNRIDNCFYIDLFHDPVKNCINFDGNVLKGNNNARIDVHEFKGDLALMGDIHMPNITQFDSSDNKQIFATYCSSLICKNYGEGDYYDADATVAQQGNINHGYNVINVNDGNVEIEFIPMTQYRHMHTLNFTDAIANDIIQNFKLQNIAMHNNVRIRYSAAFTLEQLDMLIKVLHSQCNVNYIDVQQNIDTVIGSSIITDGAVDTVYDKQYIIDIATEYAEQKSYNAKVADGDREQFISKFVNIFSAELDKISLDSVKSSYVITNVVLNNFTSISNIAINFAGLSDLTKLLGNNGIGKTNIYAGVKWLIANQIDWRQNKQHSKYNNLDYFNDKSEDDIVYGELHFTFNNTNYILQRTLQRFWRKNSKNIHDDKWRDNITKVTQDVSLIDTSTNNPLDSTSTNSIIQQAFGSYFDFTDLHVIDQSRLDYIIGLSSEQLVEFILNNLGVNFFSSLDANYHELKHKQLAQITQHSIDIPTAQANITTFTQSVDTTNIDITTTQQQIQLLTDAIQQLRTQINTTLGTKQQVNTKLLHEAAYDDAIVDINTNITKLSQQITNSNANWSAEDILALKNVTDQYNSTLELIKSHNVIIAQHNKVIETNNDNHIKLSNELTKVNAKSDDLYASAIVEQQQIKSNAAVAIVQCESNISALQNNVLTLHTQTQYDAIARNNTQLIELRSKLNILINALNNHTTQIVEYYNKITALNDDAKCLACNRLFEDITDIKAHIKSHEQEIEKLEDSKIKLATAINSINDNITKFELQNTQFNDLIKSILVDDINFTLYPEQHEQIHALKQDIENIKQSVILANKAIDNFNAATANSTLFNDALINNAAELQEQINNCTANVDVSWSQSEDEAAKLLQTQDILTQLTNTQTALNDKHTQFVSLTQLREQLSALTNIDLINAKANKQLAIANDAIIKANVIIDKQIEQLTASIDSQQKELTATNDTKQSLSNNVAALNEQIVQQNAIISDIKQASLVKYVLDSYKAAIGKKGLQMLIFDKLALQLNALINQHLSGLNYRMFFDVNDNYVLKMIDLVGQKTIRPMYRASGMEGTIAALSLISLIQQQKVKHKCNIIFIDEITGGINNGADISIESQTNKNYQQELFTLLQIISKHVKIIIIDHVLDSNWFSNYITVVKDDNGHTSIL
jgi:DNA repair exonuclease SbcCD ATPase subunit